MKIIKMNIKLYLASAILLTVLFLGLVPAQTFAATGDASKVTACDAIGATSSGGECYGGGASIDNVVRVVINTISVVVGIIAVIMIIVAGAKFITSGGDASKITSARSSLVYAVIGLIIVVFAQVIVKFVLQKTTS